MTEPNQKPSLFLIDGNNYVYRAFYAIRNLSNSKGFPTNAIYGFTAMLLKLFREHNPDYIAVVFDSRGPTFRSKAFADYKAHRPAMPETLVPQFPMIKEIIQAFAIPVIEKEGLEADDIIGILARKYAGEGLRVAVISGDKDLMQLVTADTVMIDTMKNKIYDIPAVKEYFGVEPENVAEVLGLMGDATDNIPGVPGIGQKTARNLIGEFGTIENILANVAKVKNPRIRESLEKNAALARMSRELAILGDHDGVEFNLEAARQKEPDRLRLRELFKEFEFLKLIDELDIRDTRPGEIKFKTINTPADVEELVKRLKKAGRFSLSVEPSSDQPMSADIIGVSFCVGAGEGWYLPVVTETGESDIFVFGAFSSLFADKKVCKMGHDLKSAMLMLSRQGIELKGLGCDTMVASYVLNPSKRSHALSDIVRDYLDRDLEPLKDLVGSGTKALPLSRVPVIQTARYSCDRACSVFELAQLLTDEIRKEGFEDLFCNMEMLLIEVLAAMEKRGVLIDMDAMRDMSGTLESLMGQSEQRIYTLAGEQFNINSPRQLQHILFEKLKLPKGRKTKNGHSTDADVLTALAPDYELPAEILSYRGLMKLKTTYVDTFPALVNPETGRVHTSYNQAVAATGRLSSSNPNLQNIPIRTQEGRTDPPSFHCPWRLQDCFRRLLTDRVEDPCAPIGR